MAHCHTSPGDMSSNPGWVVKYRPSGRAERVQRDVPPRAAGYEQPTEQRVQLEVCPNR